MMDKTVCFTGHRTIPADQYDAIRQRLMNVIISLVGRGYRFFGARGALRFDSLQNENLLCKHRYQKGSRNNDRKER